MTAAARPVILAVDDDPDALRAVADELRSRHGSHYRVETADGAAAARRFLARLREDGGELALALADQWMGAEAGADLLGEVPRAFPRARRGLLVDFGAWADPATADAILAAMSRGRIDYYVLKPSRSPDELFNRTVSEFLHEWSRSVPSTPREVVVVGREGAPRTYEVRSLLARNGMPFAFHEAGTAEARAVLCGARLDGSVLLPVVAFHDGRVLADPSNVEIAAAFGFPTALPARCDVDVVVVGVGPGGLAAAVYAASEGLATLVVERESIGGQAGSSSLIRNYLGFARGVGGAELAMRAYQQAWVFGASFVLMREVVAISAEGDRLRLSLSDGSETTAGAVVLALGVSYRRLGIPALESLIGAGVYYGASASEAQAMEGGRVFVVGAGNSAGQAAMHLSRHAERVTVLVRGRSLGASMSRYLIEAIEATPNVGVRHGVEVVGGGGDGRLERLVLRDHAGSREETLPAAGLFIMIGARPHTEWLPVAVRRDPWGYVLTGPDAAEPSREGRAPLGFETGMPGVFCVGDARSGSIKRVASAVGEGAAVISQVHRLRADRPVGGAAR